jgi:hypothetical protein
MAFIQQQDIPPLDGFSFTGPTRTMSGVARTLDAVLDTQYGEKMRWLYVGVTGNVSYVKWDGTTQVLIGLAAGVFHPIYSLQINSSGTTATGIVVGS